MPRHAKRGTQTPERRQLVVYPQSRGTPQVLTVLHEPQARNPKEQSSDEERKLLHKHPNFLCHMWPCWENFDGLSVTH